MAFHDCKLQGQMHVATPDVQAAFCHKQQLQGFDSRWMQKQSDVQTVLCHGQEDLMHIVNVACHEQLEHFRL